MTGEFTLGGLEDKLTKQLKDLLPVEELKRFDMDSEAISRLYVRCLCTEAERVNMLKKLVKKIKKALKDFNS